MEAARKFSNVHVVLVHESPECVSDLVANLRYLDPASTVLLYDGTGGELELAGAHAQPDGAVLVHPAPRRMEWGRLHDFAFDALRFVLTSTDADTATIVDSDQLAVRAGYSSYLSAFLRASPGIGMLVSTDRPEPSTTRIGPAQAAWTELELWRPLLERFACRRHLFPWWTYWPGTVFTRGRRSCHRRALRRPGRAAHLGDDAHVGDRGDRPADPRHARRARRTEEPVQLRLRSLPHALHHRSRRGRHPSCRCLLAPPGPPPLPRPGARVGAGQVRQLRGRRERGRAELRPSPVTASADHDPTAPEDGRNPRPTQPRTRPTCSQARCCRR